jgi:hypothetical protein
MEKTKDILEKCSVATHLPNSLALKSRYKEDV